jgi:hypothetical protein
MPVRFAVPVALAAALLALPAPSLAQPGGTALVRPAVLFGIEDGDGPAALAFRADAEFPRRALSPDVGLSLVASVGYTYDSDEVRDWGYEAKASIGILKLVPSARFTFGSQAIRPYADVGLGLYRASWSLEETANWGYGVVTAKYSDSEVGLMMRLAGGISFQVSEGFGLGAELGFSPYLGDALDQTTFNLMAMAVFRL